MVAASSEQARLLELFQLQTDEGPCLDCFRTGQPVTVPDLAATRAAGRGSPRAARRGRFRRRARAADAAARRGHRRAEPVRRRSPGALDARTCASAQALADVATIGLLQERAIRRRDILAEQLQTALNSRVIIEQAKGMLAERGGLDMDQAFTLLRGHARANCGSATSPATSSQEPPPSTPCSAPPRGEALSPAEDRLGGLVHEYVQVA